MKLTLIHNLINNVVPMRAGELSFPALMALYFGIRPSVSLPTLLWFRLLDLHAILGLGLAAALWATFGGGLALMTTLLVLPAPFLAAPLARRANRWLEKRGNAWTWRALRSLAAAVPEDSIATFRAMTWTWANWLTKLAALALVLAAIAQVSTGTALLAMVFGELTSVLPIHTLGGFGTYEGGVLAGLAIFAIDAASGLRAAFTVHLFLLGTAVAGAAGALLIPAPTSGRSAP